MKSNRNWRWVTMSGLVALAAILGPDIARAQELTGKFTLQFEARWGQAILPEGQYTFVINSTAPRWIKVQHEGQTHTFMPAYWSSTKDKETSALIVARRGSSAVIRTLYLKEIGMSLHYAAQKPGPELQAKGTVVIERVPITASGR